MTKRSREDVLPAAGKTAAMLRNSHGGAYVYPSSAAGKVCRFEVRLQDEGETIAFGF